jgi:hypothetical protein
MEGIAIIIGIPLFAAFMLIMEDSRISSERKSGN